MEEASGPPVRVLPANMIVVNVFIAMSTQWRISMAGPTGLDYGVLPEVWRRCKVPLAHRDDVFHGLRVMEDAALEKMRENQPKPKA